MVLLVVTDQIIFTIDQNVILWLLKAVGFVVVVVNVIVNVVVVALIVVTGHIKLSCGH